MCKLPDVFSEVMGLNFSWVTGPGRTVFSQGQARDLGFQNVLFYEFGHRLATACHGPHPMDNFLTKRLRFSWIQLQWYLASKLSERYCTRGEQARKQESLLYSATGHSYRSRILGCDDVGQAQVLW